MDLPPDLKEALPGIGGSATALLFFRRPWPVLIALFCCGFFAARAVGAEVAEVMNASKEVGGYVTGAFSIIASRLNSTVGAASAMVVRRRPSAVSSA